VAAPLASDPSHVPVDGTADARQIRQDVRSMSTSVNASRWQGRVVVVTGSGSGIGKECALRFAREGATVIGADLDSHAAQQTIDEAAAESLTIVGVHPVDLTTPAGAAVVADAAEPYGHVNVLINAAASAVFAWIEELSYDDWRTTLAAEIDSVFLVTQALWSLMRSADECSIINFASANAHVALAGSGALAHCAGKGGVMAMTRQLAMEGGPHNIRANTISPALILTTATRAHLESVPELRARILEKMMIKRLGETSDVANLAVFLASEESSWITASDFRLDGGATAW
jgi:NAD(P)-dependent dehydrogenase (short-subunit alcohol dehydrogenase family)